MIRQNSRSIMGLTSLSEGPIFAPMEKDLGLPPTGEYKLKMNQGRWTLEVGAESVDLHTDQNKRLSTRYGDNILSVGVRNGFPITLSYGGPSDARALYRREAVDKIVKGG